MFRALIKECREVVGENALNPDMHRDAVKALLKARGAWTKRGRNPNKAQEQNPLMWNDIEEFGSRGRTFGRW